MIVYLCDWCRKSSERSVPDSWRRLLMEEPESTDDSSSEIICEECLCALAELKKELKKERSLMRAPVKR